MDLTTDAHVYEVHVEPDADGFRVRLAFDGLVLTYGPYRSFGYAAAQADHLREHLRSGHLPPARSEIDPELAGYHVDRLVALTERLSRAVPHATDDTMRAALVADARRAAIHALDLARALGAE